MVLLVSVSVLEEVISDPLVGSVMAVVPARVKVREYAPTVAKFPARARVPVVTVMPVAAELMMTALLPLPAKSGNFPKPVSTELNSDLITELDRDAEAAGAPDESKYSVADKGFPSCYYFIF